MEVDGDGSDSRLAPTTLGERLHHREGGWFGVTEARHRPGLRLASHRHRYPAVTLVRHGSFGLRIDGETVACTERGVFFKQGEHEHGNVVGKGGATSLILELRTDDRRLGPEGLPLPGESFWTGAPGARRLAAGIASELRRRDSASALALEGLVLELLASLLRTPPTLDGARPEWLDQVEEVLRARARDGIGLGGVAAAVGRHPAHVARSFRRHFGCSVGDRLRQLRLETAADALARTDRPLAEIALEAGFYDQAHFGRCFKRWSSRSPGAYRREHRGR